MKYFEHFLTRQHKLTAYILFLIVAVVAGWPFDDIKYASLLMYAAGLAGVLMGVHGWQATRDSLNLPKDKDEDPK